MKPFPTDGMDRCKVCGRYYQPECEWNQGRCPHHPAYWERFLNLCRWVKSLFSKGRK